MIPFLRQSVQKWMLQTWANTDPIFVILDSHFEWKLKVVLKIVLMNYCDCHQTFELLWNDYLQTLQDKVTAPMTTYLQSFPHLKVRKSVLLKLDVSSPQLNIFQTFSLILFKHWLHLPKVINNLNWKLILQISTYLLWK